MPIPRKLAINSKLVKKPTYLTVDGIQRISNNSTKSRVPLVSANLTRGSRRNGTAGNEGSGRLAAIIGSLKMRQQRAAARLAASLGENVSVVPARLGRGNSFR